MFLFALSIGDRHNPNVKRTPIMNAESLFEQKDVAVRALMLGERIVLRSLERREFVALNPLVLRVRGDGVAVLFRYGAVVFFNVDAIEEASFIDQLRAFLERPIEHPRTETADLCIDPGVTASIDTEAIRLPALTIQHLQAVADMLAKSVALEWNESKVAESFEHVERMALAIKSGSISRRNAREVLAYIGETLLTEHKLVGRVEVTDKPDFLWENPELERFYTLLEHEYEIPDRHAALQRKLELISRTSETILELLHNRHSLRVEWYIVLLIVAEICLTLYELFLRHPSPR